MAADPQLRGVVAELAALGVSKQTVEWFTGDFDRYPEDKLDDVYTKNSGNNGGGNNRGQ